MKNDFFSHKGGLATGSRQISKGHVSNQNILSSLLKEHRAHRTQKETQSSSASWFEKSQILKRPSDADDQDDDDDDDDDD